MRILVLGASGLMGRTFCKILKSNNINYLGTYNKNKVDNSVYINFEDDNEIEQLFNDYKPDVCVNCIVQRLVDVCEDNWNLIKFTNIDIVNKIAKNCKKYNTYIIHISTDYVFDGLNPPYFPNSIPNPLQNYGISKLISEYKIINKLINHVIIRVPVLYSNNILNLEESAVTLIGKKVFDKFKNSKEDNYTIRRPVFIPDLCEFILNIIQNNEKYNGTYHFYNYKDKVTKYLIADIIGKCINKSIDHITPVNYLDNKVERPIDTQLLDDKYDITNFNITELKDGIDMCFKKYYHPDIFNENTNLKDLFLLLDLDGTLLDSDKIHIDCYNKAFQFLDINLSLPKNCVDLYSIDDFLKSNLDEKETSKVKEIKNKLMIDYEKDILFINGSEKLINYIIDKKINHCVVTNTSLSIVNKFKSKLNILNNLNFITKEDYNNPKPHPEPYQKAIDKFYNNEKYVLGFENSLNGFKSLRNHTSIIYMIINNNLDLYNIIKKEDVFLINDLTILK